MNSFYGHHRDSIRWQYRCFDRILLNGLIQPFQQPERVVGFFNTYRQLYPVSRHVLRDIADQFQRWLKGWSEKRNIPVADAPKGRRDDFVDPYFKGADLDAVVIILKAREPARIMTAIGDSKANRWHLQIANRWVVQYNFYINDRQWGRMFVRICPYLPFSARVCLNQHHWLANRMREEGIDFQQCANAFTRCAKPERLQQLADSLTPWDLSHCGQKWLARLTPFFTARERQESGCAWLPGRTLYPRLASLRPCKTPGQRARRQAPQLPPLSTPAARLLNLLGLPEAVRTSLCAAHCRPSQPSQRRSPNRSAKAIAARSPLSTCRR